MTLLVSTPAASRCSRGAMVRRRRVLARWRPGRELGSGVGSYEIRVDGRLRATRPTVRNLGSLLVSVEPELPLARLSLGSHRISVVAVDRAGNRSAPATRRFTVSP